MVNKRHIQRIRNNHLVWWAVILGSTLFLSLLISIWSIDEEVLEHPHIVNGRNFEILLHLLAAAVAVWFTRYLIFRKAKYLNDRCLKPFNRQERFGAYDVSRPRRFFPGKKPYRHAVLLLHGFTASTQEFEILEEHLKAAGIPYLAPMLPGFGVDSTDVLKEVTRKDWVRTATDHFDMLSEFAEEVSVLGHSLGGMIATAVTKERKAKNLILSAPGLYPMDTDIKYKVALTRPILSDFYMALIPYLPKPLRAGRISTSDTLDEEKSVSGFQYLAVPVHSVQQVFLLQNETDILESRYDRLSVIYGVHDLTVNVRTLLRHLDQAEAVYDLYEFEDSAHNVLEDRESEQVCQVILGVLSEEERGESTLPSPPESVGRLRESSLQGEG